MRNTVRGMLFAVLASIVPKAAAEPRVAMLQDQRYLCTNCTMALNHTVYRDIVQSMYPNLEQINSVDGQGFLDALARNDALFIPLMNGANLADVITDQQVAALRVFVRNGGRIIQRLIYDGHDDLPQKFLNKVFETPLFQGVDATPAPNFTCDAAQAAVFGWNAVPASGRAPFYGAAINGSVPGFSNICAFASNPNAITIAGFVYGEGVIYVDGIFNGNPGDWSDEQKSMTRQMVESDLLGPHRCFLKDGAVKCGGGNRVGQLGAGDAESRALPLRDLPIVDLGRGFAVARIGMTTGTTCALSTTGQLKCWGFNKSGQLARGDVLPRGQNPADMGEGMPIVDFGSFTVKDFSVGRNHVCAITSDDVVRCWGAGGNGRLGTESTANVGDTPESHPVAVLLPNGVKPARVVAGRNHSCVLSTMGQVHCFGENVRGQIGTGNAAPVGDRAGTMGEALRAVDLGTNFKVAQLASGLDHNCALSDKGKVKCWGANQSGELGQSATYAARGAAPQEMGDALPFTDLGEGQIATELQCGFAHCCVQTLQKTMKCWGANDSGQLGLGDTLSRGKGPADMGDSLPFVRLPIGEPVTGMELVGHTTCATTPSGTRCWGQNSAGQLADGKKLDLGGKPDSVPRLLTPIAW